MQPRKLSCLFVFFAYAGNSTGTSEVADIREWFSGLLLKLKTDPAFKDRVDKVAQITLADTPITMTRNRAVKICRKMGFDILVMVDSDMRPDVHLGQDPLAVPFFETAFDAIYQHYERGPLVIAAPYGGSPPHENMFVFKWERMANMGDESSVELRQYLRSEAAQLSGLQEAGALPTGLIAYDIRAFDLIEKPYFYYEWKDEDESEKASTEDVTNTRDIAISGVAQLGYNPCLCAWDSWAGHLKTWCVGKPTPYTTENVSEALAKAIERGISAKERIVDLEFRNREILKGKEVIRHTEEEPPEDPGHKTPQEHLEFLKSLVRVRSTVKNSRRMVKKGKTDRTVDLINVIELGSWLGDSAIAMADTGLAKVLCVDHFKGNPSDHTGDYAQKFNQSEKTLYERFLDNIGHRHKRTIFDFRGSSKDVAGFLDEMGRSAKQDMTLIPFLDADVVFIDADHTYESVKEDILTWLPFVADNGVMLGHDYETLQFPGLTQAVKEIFGDAAKEVGKCQYGSFWMVNMDAIDREAILARYGKTTQVTQITQS